MEFLKIFEVMDSNYSPNQQKRIEDLLPKSAKKSGNPIDKSQCKIQNYAFQVSTTWKYILYIWYLLEIHAIILI